jgi:hypothetical protein
MRVRIYKNTPRKYAFHKSLGVGHLPGHQTLVWAGPLFITIVRKR